MPTLINRGLGLLEVILPRGTSDDDESVLPPGQRDGSGFWFPAGYSDPASIFSPIQRELQANQRRIQKRRIATKLAPPVQTDSPQAPIDPLGLTGEVAMPLPSPLCDGVAPRANGPPARPESRPAPKTAPTFRSNVEGPLLPDSD